jgi:hypothetical protein
MDVFEKREAEEITGCKGKQNNLGSLKNDTPKDFID